MSKSWRWLILVFIGGLGVLILVSSMAAFQPGPDQPGKHPLMLAYLSPANNLAALWITTLGGIPQQVSEPGQKVLDFGPAPDGQHLVYAVRNAQEGSDLWTVDRTGRNASLLLSCGSDQCGAPAWSPDGKRVAFTRQVIEASGQGLTASRLWTVDVNSRQAAPLFPGATSASAEPSWSPDGHWLAYADEIKQGVWVLDLITSQNYRVAARRPDIGGWSSDSRELFFADLDLGDLPTYGMAFGLEPASHQASALFAKGPPLVDYGAPSPSPTGDWLSVTVRFIDGNANRQIWLLSEDGSKLKVIQDDPLKSHGASTWSPDGTYLAFQRFTLGTSQTAPELLVWVRNGEQVIVVAQNAFRPQWIP